MYLFSGATCKMTYSTADPMALRSPSCAKASIRTKRAAKKTKVAHSTLAKTDSTSDLSDNTSNDIAPKRATQPRLKFKLGIFCRKNNSTTITRTTTALTSKSLLVILQDSSSEWMEELWLSPEFSKYFLWRIVSQKFYVSTSAPFCITKRCPYFIKHVVNLKLN